MRQASTPPRTGVRHLNGFLSYFSRRLFGALLVVWLVATIVFLMLRITGDPVASILPQEATSEDVQRVRSQLGLDQPVPVQYVRFLGGLVTGDLGNSYRFREPVIALIAARLPATFTLAGAAMLLAIAVAVPMAIFSARYRNSVADYLLSSISFLGYSVPNFWLGFMLIILFSVQLRLLPTSGSGSLAHLVLPAITLAFWPLAQIARLLRSELIDVLGEDYVRTARAKGLREESVMSKHALRNASLSVVTLIGVITGTLLAGAVVTEIVFAWPGLGQLSVQAIHNRDFPIVQSAVVYMSMIVVLANLAVDLLYGVLDPRIRFK